MLGIECAMFFSPVKKGFSQRRRPLRVMRERPSMWAGRSPTSSSGPNELANMVSFVTDQIGADVAALSPLDEAAQKAYLTSSMRLRAFFSGGSPTYRPLYTSLFGQTVQSKGLWQGTVDSMKPGTVPKRLAKTISQDVWELLAANYLIAPRGQGHPTKVGGGNLKEAMGVLTPGAAPTYP